MIVYACMCEQMLDCEYVIILMSCAMMQCIFLLYFMNLYVFILHGILVVFHIMVMFEIGLHDM